VDRRLAVSFTLTCLLAAVAGCSGADGSGDESSESLPWQTESSSAADVELTPDEAAIAAFEAYWQAISEAAAIPDPAYAALSDVASEQALDGAIAMIQEQVDEGTRADGVITLSDTAVVERTPEGEPTQIVVESCVDTSTAVIIDIESGTPVSDATYGRRYARAVVLLEEDRWYVRAINTEEVGTC
jgi:lysozyme family protein